MGIEWKRQLRQGVEMVGREEKETMPLRASEMLVDFKSPPVIVALGSFGRRMLSKSRNDMPVLGGLDIDEGDSKTRGHLYDRSWYEKRASRLE